MLGRTNTGGGVGGLNFKVVGGTTAPDNPKENTIWLNTDTEITGWIFSATEPTDSVDGMVWISTGTSSPAEFNALKKNGVQVYPTSAMQNISGVWINKETTVYQTGAWKSLEVVLLNGSFQNPVVTGGWEGNTTYTVWTNAPSTHPTFDSNGIVFANKRQIASTKNAVDVTAFSTLKMNVVAFTGYVVFSLMSGTTGAVTSGTGVLQARSTGVHSIDVSALSGKYYITIASDGSDTATIDKVWLEA